MQTKKCSIFFNVLTRTVQKLKRHYLTAFWATPVTALIVDTRHGHHHQSNLSICNYNLISRVVWIDVALVLLSKLLKSRILIQHFSIYPSRLLLTLHHFLLPLVYLYFTLNLCFVNSVPLFAFCRVLRMVLRFLPSTTLNCSIHPLLLLLSGCQGEFVWGQDWCATNGSLSTWHCLQHRSWHVGQNGIHVVAMGQ